MQTVEVEYECCGTKLSRFVPLGEDETLLANPALGDYVLGEMDAEHDARHPECQPIPYTITEEGMAIVRPEHAFALSS